MSRSLSFVNVVFRQRDDGVTHAGTRDAVTGEITLACDYRTRDRGFCWPLDNSKPNFKVSCRRCIQALEGLIGKLQTLRAAAARNEELLDEPDEPDDVEHREVEP